MGTQTREDRNAKARERYAAHKAAAEPSAELLAAVQQDWTSEAPVFTEPQATRLPGQFDEADWRERTDIKTPEGLARAHLDLARREVRDAKELLRKYEHEVRWRSIRAGHPQRLIDKYVGLVEEYKLVLQRAEANLEPYWAAVEAYNEQRRTEERNGWLLLGHSVAEALGFGPERSDEVAKNSGYTIWNPQPDMYVRYSEDGSWDVGLRDPATDERLFGYDANVYSPRMGSDAKVAASWGSYSGMKHPADNRAQLRVLTLATRIAEAVADYFGFPRSGDDS